MEGSLKEGMEEEEEGLSKKWSTLDKCHNLMHFLWNLNK